MSERTSITRKFPEARVSVVHQDGTELTVATIGADIVLHTRQGEQVPCCAELDSGGHYAEIGLWFEGKTLSEYDGVFCLPKEVAIMLTDLGFTVPPEMYDDSLPS